MRVCPAGCKWIGLIDDATHMSFAGAGFAETTEKLTMLETKAFLDGLRAGKCGTPLQAGGIAVKKKANQKTRPGNSGPPDPSTALRTG